jgi:hypothetical protein
MKILPSFQLKLPFPSFSKPSFEVHEDVKNLMRKPPKSKKDELPKFWTARERIIVGILLGGTILLSILFWYKGQNGNINLTLPKIEEFGFGETVVIEK